MDTIKFTAYLLYFLAIFSLPWFIFNYLLKVASNDATVGMTVLWVPFVILLGSAFEEAKKKKQTLDKKNTNTLK